MSPSWYENYTKNQLNWRSIDKNEWQ